MVIRGKGDITNKKDSLCNLSKLDSRTIWNPWLGLSPICDVVLERKCFVINSLTFDWEPKHVIIRVFEASDVARISLAMQICVLEKHNFLRR
jgi:hypothetical protein